MKKIIAMLLALVMVFALCACGSQPAAEQTQAPAAEESKAPAEETPAAAEDTITVMVPPVTGTYLDDIDKWAAEFTEMYPNLHIEVIKTSWDDHNSKLSTMATSGEAPDIAEVSYSTIGSLVELGVGVEIADYMDADRLADYDQNAMDYMSIEGKAYGLPLYITIQSLGANREMLEAAGADVAKIQSEGWTYEEFLEILKAGTTSDCFGFVFANSGVTASDVPNIMGVMAGLTNAFTDDLKYAFTSDNMLNLLNAIEEMTKAGYMPNYGVEAGQRMVMCQQGKAMIFGKAMPLFENNINKNNAALEANDGTAVENSIALTYAFLPMPHMDGGVTRAVVYDRSGAAIYAEPGWRLRISAYCRAADTRYGEDYDYYNSNGIFLVASVKTPPEVIYAQRSAWLSFGQDISSSVCAEIERIFPRDAAAFMKSLLIGSREELYEDAGAYMAMGRAGITHIVAISGMHVAFLISILQLALGKSRRSSVLCIIAVWVFVAATGASQSAVRAGVMQSMLLIAPIFGRENDPPTSLMTALAILLAANPYSAASVSLQLSFGAVAGLMLFSEKLSALLMPDVPRGTLRRIIPGKRCGKLTLRHGAHCAAGGVAFRIHRHPVADCKCHVPLGGVRMLLRRIYRLPCGTCLRAGRRGACVADIAACAICTVGRAAYRRDTVRGFVHRRRDERDMDSPCVRAVNYCRRVQTAALGENISARRARGSLACAAAVRERTEHESRRGRDNGARRRTGAVYQRYFR